MLGWLAILVHFAAPAFNGYFPRLAPFTPWIKVCTLIIAGTFFLLSVSEVFIQRRRRIAFVLFVSAAAVLYLTGWRLHVRTPWIYVSLLFISTGFGLVQAIRFYGWKSAHLYLLLPLLPYGAWAAQQSHAWKLAARNEFLPCWVLLPDGVGLLPPFSQVHAGSAPDFRCVHGVGLRFSRCRSFSSRTRTGPGQGSFFWDLPKFFVAFGMILTLFESQTDVASTVARQYRVAF